jgi:formyl-CoA transferase
VNNTVVDRVVTDWTERRTKDEIIEALGRAGVPCSPVRSTGEVMHWPQLLEREMIVPLLNPLTGTAAAASAPGFPIKFSRTPASYDSPAPIPGSHTEEILIRFANLSPAEVPQLRKDGII